MKAQLVLEDVGVRYPQRVLFENVNWTLYEGMRVALAGRNGCGKSTLLQIMSGQAEPTDGSCTIVGGKRLRIGYLNQTLLDTAVLDAKNSEGQNDSVVNYVKNKLTFDISEIEDAELNWSIEKTLSGLGFTAESLKSPIESLSGGWLLRMFIGAAILDRPDVLLLDEPTNHLDISSIQWLEEFLTEEYEGSLVLVTHDVALQKRTTNSLATVHGGHFYFRKHQNDYLTFRESLKEEKDNLLKNIERIDKKKRDVMGFINKYRAKARMASRAQSKLKEVERYDAELSELQDRLKRVEGHSYNLRFRFRMDSTGGKFPVVAENLSFKYSDAGPWILRQVNFDVKRGQKIGIIGDNGAGKTTLLNVLAGRLDPIEGNVSTAHKVALGYFGQHQLDELLLDDTALDNLRAKAEGVGLEQLRRWLGAFGFSTDEEVSKKANVLSGGERARLALLRILVSPINLCLLDEPTNHLDIETKELLKDAIKNFEGTVIFVSHDREFVESVAERILYVSLDHQITDHLGDLDSFFEKFPEKVRHLEGKSLQKKTKKEKPKTEQLSYEERKQLRNKTRSLEKKISTIEKEIDSLGEEKESLQAQTESENFYAQNSEEQQRAVFDKLASLESTLTNKMTEWEKLSLDLEKCQQNK